MNRSALSPKHHLRPSILTIAKLVEEIQENAEWMTTVEEDEVQCISIENLEGILSRFLNANIKLTQDE